MKIKLGSQVEPLTRRVFVRVGGATAVALAGVGATACGDGGEAEDDGATTDGAGNTGNTGTGNAGTGNAGTGGENVGGSGASASGGQGQGGTGGEPTPACGPPTEDDIEGPFYTPGAPTKTALYEPGMPGVRLTISGRVTNTDCEPIAGATLDVWQADDDGAYDNVGFLLRGLFTTDANGEYTVDTIIPGHYLNGAQYRPAHVHVKASGPGFAELTTQLYFEGDPYNDIDPFIDDALIMPVTDVSANEKACTFDFVLLPL